jgi:hypothetical protein
MVVTQTLLAALNVFPTQLCILFTLKHIVGTLIKPLFCLYLEINLEGTQVIMTGAGL